MLVDLTEATFPLKGLGDKHGEKAFCGNCWESWLKWKGVL